MSLEIGPVLSHLDPKHQFLPFFDLVTEHVFCWRWGGELRRRAKVEEGTDL